MEGSPVRGQQKLTIIPLNHVQDVQSFQAEIVRLLGSEFKHAEVLFGIVEMGSTIPQLPTWLRSHLERAPGLEKKLAQGEMIGISAAEQSPVLRPAAVAQSNVVLIPLISEGRLTAAIGFVSSPDEMQLSAEDIEAARQFAYDVAPIFARLQEIEKLRLENNQSLVRAERTERAEEKLAIMVEEKKILDAVLQMQSHLQGNLAHELRTPLAAIRGYSRMILDGRSGEINEKQREYLQIVSDNTSRLISLVSWMSHVVEISAQHLKPTSFDFRDIWMECANTSEQKLAEKSLKLSQEVPEEPFPMIADREKLSYVLNELMDSAVKLADAETTLNAEMSHGREKEVNFKLSVSGSISSDVLSTIFQRSFDTVATSTPQNAESSATNLSGVHDIIGMHGGRFFVNNTGGQGAVFLFTLPAVTAGEENSHEQAVNSSRRRR